MASEAIRVRDPEQTAEAQGKQIDMPAQESLAEPTSSENRHYGPILTGYQDRWHQVEKVMSSHFHEPDVGAARVLYAAVAAHGLADAPVWIMLIGPPGSMKTELVLALDGLDEIHVLDEVTQNTFISGRIEEVRGREPASLLHRIGKSGILVFPDFSTLIGANAETRAKILAQMRRIYDGSLRREFGHTSNVDERGWKGHVTCIVAVTPEIDQHYGVIQALGDRFVQLRLHRPDGRKAATRAMLQDLGKAKEDLKAAVQGLFKDLPSAYPTIQSQTSQKLAALAEFVARARSHVPRDGRSKQVLSLATPEAPTRLAKQLKKIVEGSARLAHRLEAEEADYRVALRAGLDSIPPIRRRILAALSADSDVHSLALPRQTCGYALEELGLLELAHKDGKWSPSEYARELINDFMSSSSDLEPNEP